MLTRADIEFIKDNRKELTHNRTDSVILYHESTGTEEDPLTGEPIPADPVQETVEATWLRYTSESPGTDDLKVVDGVIAEEGDVFANFDLSVDLSDVRTVKHVASGETWRIRGIDAIGLGDPNRYYVLLGRVT